MVFLYTIDMLSSDFRFHGHGSLRYLYKNADAFRAKFFTIKVLKNSHRNKSRFAVVVSKKVHKSAVGRNRMRRRIYEILRSELPKLNDVYDIVVIITTSEVITADFTELQSSMRSLFEQADLY